MTRMMRGRNAAEPELLESQEQVVELCARCRAEGRFAFDTEFVMEDRYETEVCLIQIATQDRVTLIDPFKKLDLRAVWDLVSDDKVETVVHSGQEDLALSFQHTGQVPQRVWDVQIAAGLAGYDYPLSLQKLVQALLHIRLHKSKTLTDWRKRPLTASQILYAAEDVCHLLAVRDKLYGRLKELGRTDWAKEEFRGFEHETVYKRAQEDRLFRIKGAGSLHGVQLAILQQLLDWRDSMAQSRNRPARTIIKDHILIEIARHGPATYADLRELRGLNLSDKDIHGLARMVKAAAALPAEQWPAQPPRDTESPSETVLIALLTAVLRSFCARHELAYGLVATKQMIRDLIRHRASKAARDSAAVELMHGWRGKSVGRMLHEILSGQRVLRVTTQNGEMGLDVE